MLKKITGYRLYVESNGIESDVFSDKSTYNVELSFEPKIENGMVNYMLTEKGKQGFVRAGISLSILKCYSINPIFED